MAVATAIAALAGGAAIAADSAIGAHSGPTARPHAGHENADLARTRHAHPAIRVPARPVPPHVRVSEKWGAPGGWAAGHHTGMDFAVRPGTPVRSVGAGEVVHAGPYGAYGNAVTVRMKDGKYALFAHLSRTRVHDGQTVRAGTLVGRSGNTGRTTGPHLHFEVRAKPGYGSDVDPAAWLSRHTMLRRP